MLRTSLNLFLVISFLLGFGSQTSQGFSRLDGSGPIVMGTNKRVVIPGEIVNFTVGLSGVATGDEVFSVTAPSGSFLHLPTTISPEPGATSITFTGIVGISLFSEIQVSVTDGQVTVPAPTLLWFLVPPSGF